MKAPESHRIGAPKNIGFYIVTVSSSRYAKEQAGEEFADESGDLAVKQIEKSNYTVETRTLIADDAELISEALETAVTTEGVDVAIFMGGTGLSPNDITIETVRPNLEKEIEGFGETFRSISYKKIGGAAMLTRATAGVIRGRLILCLPGSPDAVETALDLFIPEIPHVLHVLHQPKR